MPGPLQLVAPGQVLGCPTHTPSVQVPLSEQRLPVLQRVPLSAPGQPSSCTVQCTSRQYHHHQQHTQSLVPEDCIQHPRQEKARSCCASAQVADMAGTYRKALLLQVHSYLDPVGCHKPKATLWIVSWPANVNGRGSQAAVHFSRLFEVTQCSRAAKCNAGGFAVVTIDTMGSACGIAVFANDRSMLGCSAAGTCCLCNSNCRVLHTCCATFTRQEYGRLVDRAASSTLLTVRMMLMPAGAHREAPVVLQHQRGHCCNCRSCS